MGMEFELKFAADEAAQQAVRSTYPLAYRQISMETTYFDTADRALSARHVTLRRRLEDGQAVCTVKTPLEGQGRGEWECLCEDIETAIFMLCKLGAPKDLLYLTSQGVGAVCGARFTRQAAQVEHLGAELEIALDRGVLIGGGREAPLCEIEVELKTGTPEAAIDFAAHLQAQFGLQPESRSKFRRALALAEGEGL